MNEQIEKYFLEELTLTQKNELFRQMTSNTDLRDEFAHGTDGSGTGKG